MSTTSTPLTKYYVVMIQPGDGGLGPNEMRLAAIWPEEEPGSLEKIKEPYGIIPLFSSFSRAQAFRERDGRYKSSDGWVSNGIDTEFCRELLLNYAGKATYAALDPGEVLVTSEPIADFLAAMPHTLDPNRE